MPQVLLLVPASLCLKSRFAAVLVLSLRSEREKEEIQGGENEIEKEEINGAEICNGPLVFK